MEDENTRRLAPLAWPTVVVAVIGALNWGSVGLFGVDLVAEIFGASPVAARLVYALVGLAGIYLPFAIASLRAARHGTRRDLLRSDRGTAAG